MGGISLDSPNLSPTFLAVGFMLLAAACLAAMHGFVRMATTSFEMHPFVVAFFRNLVGFFVLVPILVRGGSEMFMITRPGMHLLRGFLNAGSMLMWFYALSLIVLADATALTLTGPMFVAFFAIVFLGERVGLWRWGAILICAMGAFCVVRPGFQEVSLGAILTIGCVCLASLSKICAKKLTSSDDPATVAASVQLLMMVITLVPALFFWDWPTLPEFGLLLLIGTLGGFGHYSFTRAYAIADISFAEPIVFTRMIWATAFGYFVFSEVPNFWTWIGALLIVCATSTLAHRERINKGQSNG